MATIEAEYEQQQKKDFAYYLAHQDELVESYNGKYIVLKHSEVIGAYDSDIEAVTETQKEHPLGTFLVQKVSPGNQDYTATFHSRARLA